MILALYCVRLTVITLILATLVSISYADVTYVHLKTLYQTGHQEEAIAQAVSHLATNPFDSDIRLALGQFYYNNKDYLKAQDAVSLVLQQHPDYVDARLVLINIEMALNHLEEANTIADIGLLLNPLNPNLLKKKHDIEYTILREKPPLLLSQPQAEEQAQALAAAQAQAAQQQPPPEPSYIAKIPGVEEYKRLNQLYATGQRYRAIQQATTYLKKHPTDGDVRLVLGKFYFDGKQYAKAQHELTIVLRQTPHYIDARLILINTEMTLHHYHQAMNLAKEGLTLSPNSPDLRLKRKNIVNAINDERIKPEKKIEPVTPKPPEKKYKNEIGLSQQQYYISDVKKVWDYSTVFYGHETPVGKVYGKVTYANRLSKQGVQGEIEAYPKLNKYIYLDLDFSFANQPFLFPEKAAGGEAYVTAGKAFDFSVGGKYNYINTTHRFSLYTGSLSKDFKDNRVTFRPRYFVSGSGEKSLLYTVDLRHTIRDPLYYIGCTLGEGTSPDLANLETVNFIVLRNKLVSPYINIPFYNDRLIVNLNFLYLHQTFPHTGRVRNWTGGTLGVSWNY